MEARHIVALVLIFLVMAGLVITGHVASKRANPEPEPRLK
jgi:hypothetical protein